MKHGLIAMSLITLVIAGTMVFGSLATDCDPGGDLVFVETGTLPVFSVTATGSFEGTGKQCANGEPLPYGDSFSFRSEEIGWPVTLSAYGGPEWDGPLASVTIPGPPPEGGRWFVSLEYGEDGYFLEYDSVWPLEE